MTIYDAFYRGRSSPAVRIFSAIALAFLLLIGLAQWSRPATAQSACVPREVALEQLGERHAEIPIAMGLTQDGRVVEIFSSNDGATWTMLVTTPNGMSCLLTSGESWMKITPALVGQVV